MSESESSADTASIRRLLAIGRGDEARSELIAALTRVGWACDVAADADCLTDMITKGGPALVLFEARNRHDLEHVAACFIGQSDAVEWAGELPDSEAFAQLLQRALEQASRRKHTVAVLCIDLGASRTEIDAEESDIVFSELAQRLRSSLRDRDVLGRLDPDWGGPQVAQTTGHRFTLMLELRRPHDASNVARRLLELLTEPIELRSMSFTPSFHVGIALGPQDGTDARALLDLSQNSAITAHDDGPNSLRYSSASMNTAALELLSMESSLRRALRDREFEVHYQPKIEIATERISGMEALVRWRHPDLGMISPAQFIPVAEDTGLIGEIGDFVLRQACSDARDWKRAGLGPIRMAVNLSSVQFRDPDLFNGVMRAVDEVGYDPNWLELELTESMLMEDAESAVEILKQFKRQGIHISIDDFGTGYSSLSYLKRFPIDSLKIDRSFITDVNTNPDDASISTSIILMGRSLKLRVIAEGVETKSQLSFLRVMQCDEVQGFLFSPPVPEPAARELLERQGKRAA